MHSPQHMYRTQHYKGGSNKVHMHPASNSGKRHLKPIRINHVSKGGNRDEILKTASSSGK